MRNFPYGFRSGLAHYFDAKGTLLSERVKRLNVAIDAFWQTPFTEAVVTGHNRRLAKLFQGINFNHFFRQRLELNGVSASSAEAGTQNDARPRIVLSADNLRRSFDDVEVLFARRLPAGAMGCIIRGMGSVILNWFALQFFARVLACYRENGSAAFPEDI